MNSNALLILDTHVWIGWVEQDPRLRSSIREAIENESTTIAISCASVYELIVLVRRQRVIINRPLEDWITLATQEAGIEVLQINLDITQTAGDLPFHHGDPVDRIIIATALYHDAYLASVDSRFPDYQELAGRLLDGALVRK